MLPVVIEVGIVNEPPVGHSGVDPSLHESVLPPGEHVGTKFPLLPMLHMALFALLLHDAVPPLLQTTPPAACCALLCSAAGRSARD